MTKKDLEQACKDTWAYKANESATETAAAAYLAKIAADKAWIASLWTKHQTSRALGATPEYMSMIEAQDD